MQSPLPHGKPDAPAKRPSLDSQALLADARRLQHAARVGAPQPLLRGKKLGLLCGAGDADEALLFRHAANELGAHVAHIRSAFTADSTATEVRDTARMLGRLYDAVECQGLPPSQVQQLAGAAGIPIYDGLASQAHASAELAVMLDGDEPQAEKRRRVLQAVLLATVV